MFLAMALAQHEVRVSVGQQSLSEAKRWDENAMVFFFFNRLVVLWFR